MNDAQIINAMTHAQFGTPEQADAIEKHMKEYFVRWPNYKDRFTHLEWYHIFLDFHESLEIENLKGQIAALQECVKISQQLNDRPNRSKADQGI